MFDADLGLAAFHIPTVLQYLHCLHAQLLECAAAGHGAYDRKSSVHCFMVSSGPVVVCPEVRSLE